MSILSAQPARADEKVAVANPKDVALVTAVMASRMVDAALDTRAIDSSLLASFELMAQYASAGYCNVAGTIGSVVSCEENTCDDLVANGVTIMATLESGWEATGGVVLKDDVNQAIVVSFSGTAVLDDWVLKYIFALFSKSSDYRMLRHLHAIPA